MTDTSQYMHRTPLRPFKWVQTVKARRKEMFWAWIAYQSVKGALTTALIWVPAMA